MNKTEIANESFDFSLGDYFQEIGKSPLLSREQEKELSCKLKKRREQLIKLLNKVINLTVNTPKLLKFFGLLFSTKTF